MKNVVISTSRGKNARIQTSASTWGQLASDLQGQGYDLSGMKAIVGGLNITLESTEAVLPSSDFTLFLSPVKIKAGFSDANSYEFDYELDEVEELSYTELRAELKSIRTQASELEDEEMLELIGNYTHDTVSQLAEKLANVYKAVIVEEEEAEESEEQEADSSNLAQRVFEIEYQLGIVNANNESEFFRRKSLEREEILSTIE